MKITDAKIGLEVVRSKGDYVVGQISIIDQINFENSKIHTTQGYWVNVESFEPTSIPFEIIPAKHNKKTGRMTNPKYLQK